MINGRTKRGKLEKALDKEIERVFYKFGTGIQINMMDIPKIFDDAKIEHSAGVPIEQAMPAIIERYRAKTS